MINKFYNQILFKKNIYIYKIKFFSILLKLCNKKNSYFCVNTGLLQVYFMSKIKLFIDFPNTLNKLIKKNYILINKYIDDVKNC